MGYNTSCADYAVISDRYTGADNHIGPKPAALADRYRSAVAQSFNTAIRRFDPMALPGNHWMYRGHNCEIRPKGAALADCHRSIVLDGKIVVKKAV